MLLGRLELFAVLVLFFPSFFLHRVTQIIKGERESLVLWIGGDAYQ